MTLLCDHLSSINFGYYNLCHNIENVSFKVINEKHFFLKVLNRELKGSIALLKVNAAGEANIVPGFLNFEEVAGL